MKNLAGVLAILLGVCAGPSLAQTDEDLINDPQTPEDVLVHSMGYDRKSYSPLEEINKTNIHRLVPIWSTSLMNQSGELAAPAIHEGVLYAINGSWTFAIDLETGRQIWRTPVVLEEGSRRRSSFNRGGPVIYEGRLFRVTVDNHVLALDMETGEELWNQKFADGAEGYYATGAPMVANGVLISGMSGGESTTRGFLDGWDPATGEKLWRRYTIPGPGEPGHETWPADSDAYLYGGAPTWRTGSYDSRAGPRLLGDRQRRALRPGDARRARQPLRVDGARDPPEDGRDPLLLPVHPQRRVRRGRHRRAGPGRDRGRRRDAQGDESRPTRTASSTPSTAPTARLSPRTLTSTSTGPPTSTWRPAGRC